MILWSQDLIIENVQDIVFNNSSWIKQTNHLSINLKMLLKWNKIWLYQLELVTTLIFIHQETMLTTSAVYSEVKKTLSNLIISIFQLVTMEELLLLSEVVHLLDDQKDNVQQNQMIRTQHGERVYFLIQKLKWGHILVKEISQVTQFILIKLEIISLDIVYLMIGVQEISKNGNTFHLDLSQLKTLLQQFLVGLLLQKHLLHLENHFLLNLRENFYLIFKKKSHQHTIFKFKVMLETEMTKNGLLLAILI